MQDVSKVMIGAAAVTSNGEVVGSIGTVCTSLLSCDTCSLCIMHHRHAYITVTITQAMIAMIASAHNVPVCVCSETFKVVWQE